MNDIKLTAVKVFDRHSMPASVAEVVVMAGGVDEDTLYPFRCIADGMRDGVSNCWRAVLLCEEVVGEAGTVTAWAAVSCNHEMLWVDGKLPDGGLTLLLATALSSLALSADGEKGDIIIATVKPEFTHACRSLGFTDVRQYKRVSDGWIVVGPGRSASPDEARLHAPPRTVCSVPLADGEMGEMA